MKRFRLVFLVLTLLSLLITACGDVEWFPSNTVNNEPTPSPFSFTPALCAPPSTLVESNEIEISNVTSPATVSVAGGEYLTSGGVWTSDSKLYTPGADKKLKIKVRHMSADGYGKTMVTLLTVGRTTGSFISVVNDSTTATVCRNTQ